jgi:exopolysaccharide biosynthesis protein
MKERTSYAFLGARHPRTFIGIDRDTTKMFLCTVDGRQPGSIGMNYREMADFLLSIGVWHATNLDGGGSTTMVVQGKIVNSPSDKKGERPVANSLQIVKLGPASSTH